MTLNGAPKSDDGTRSANRAFPTRSTLKEHTMTTGKKAASTASKELKSGSSSKSEKSVAGSDLSQAKGGKKK
jgi:hypothetical protein